MEELTITYEEIKNTIAALHKKRTELVEQANLQLANLNGRIAGLEALIAPPEETEPETAPDEA